MKINEPKTPYAKHYDPSEDPSDEDEPIEGGPLARAGARERSTGGRKFDDDIPGLSLGDPEEEIPQDETSKKEKAVHVDASGAPVGHEEEVGLTPEEREKHRKFEEMRKKHYEMKDVAQLLGNPDELPEDEDEEMGGVPRVPNGSA